MEFYTDNSNDRPYNMKYITNNKKEEKTTSHDYEYWTNLNKKYSTKKNNGIQSSKI